MKRSAIPRPDAPQRRRKRRKGASPENPVRWYERVEDIPVYPMDRPLEPGEYRRPFYSDDDGWLRLIGKDVTFPTSIEGLRRPVTVFVPSEEQMDAVMFRVYHKYSKSKVNQDSYIGAIVGQIRDDDSTRSVHTGTRMDTDRRAPRPLAVHTRQHIAHYVTTIRTCPDHSGMTEYEREIERDERRLQRDMVMDRD